MRSVLDVRKRVLGGVMTETSALSKAAILYVDDDQENLESFKAVFRRSYNVHLANSAREALAILDRVNIQVLITDQRMPEMSGSELLENVADNYPDMLRFMLTGFSDFDPLVNAINQGRIQGYFSKPLDVSHVKERIENGLATFYLKVKNEELNNALRQSEARLRSIFNQAAVGIAAIENDGRFRMVNKRLCDMLGYMEDDLLTKHLNQVVPHDDVQPGAARLKALLENRITSFKVESQCRCRDDSCIWVSMTLSTVRSGNGAGKSLIAIVEDFTPRKTAEKEAQEARLFTENLIQTANAMILGLDQDGCIQLINPVVEKLTGYTADELIGQNWFELIVPQETYPHVWKEFYRLIDGGLPHLFKNPIQAKDGTERIISWSNSELVQDGAVVGTLSVGIDITQRTEAEKEKARLFSQLRQAQKMEAIGTLAGGIAHDFNNILSPIIGYAEIIMADSEPASDNSKNAHQILNAGLRARDLVFQILTFSREREQEKKPFKIQSVIKEALKLLRASMPSTVTLRQRIDDGCGPIMGDPTQIYQVIVNLFTNANQAMQNQEGQIKVVVEEILLTDDDQPQFMEVKPGPFIRVSVSDTGPGIDPDITERIFDPYFTTKRMKSGTGLGLSVVHGIVKGHAGAIKVYSELGEGTSFSVYLPRLVDDKTAAAIGTGSPIPGGKESILLVDDEEALVRVVQKILENLGYQVTGFSDSRDALSHFKARPDTYDLVISDMTMPHLTGLQLSEAILAETPDIPVVICTGFSEMINRIKVAEAGIRRVVMKPVVKSEIASTIREVLDG